MKILISPAKTLNESFVETRHELTTPAFSKEATQLARKLKKLKPADIRELMHVSDQIAELNALRFKKWHLTDTQTDAVHPAGWMFNGEVYRGLEFSQMDSNAQVTAQEKLRILSGMYGLLKPFDLIHPYRLEMGTPFSPSEKFENLYGFWGNKLRKAIEKEMDKSEIIVNLASNEYSKAAQLSSMKRLVISPAFKELRNGEYKMITVFAKLARGKMARYLIESDGSTLEDVLAFNRDGYQYMPSISTEKEPVFVR